MSRTLQGQGQAGLEAIYLNERQALVRFLRARGAGEEAEDIVQELWMKLSLVGSGPIADPSSYLYRAANNLMISRHRSAERSDRREEEWSSLAESDHSFIDRAASAREEIAAAEQRLRNLGERVLRIFVMFRLHGIAQRDIAAQLGLSLSSVEKDLQRAYRAIADLKGEFNAD